jgi:hypothetical protein
MAQYQIVKQHVGNCGWLVLRADRSPSESYVVAQCQTRQQAREALTLRREIDATTDDFNYVGSHHHY